MLPLVDKPIIQYGVEEALAAGCDHIIIVTTRGKAVMEDHFDISVELELSLEKRGRTDLLELAKKVGRMADISYVRQRETLGLGHAVLQAKDLVGDEPFAVILPDDVLDCEVPCTKQLIDAFHAAGGSVIGTEVVEGPTISAYGVLDCVPVAGKPRLMQVRGMVEKPKFEDAPSNNAIIGRYILTPRVFEMLEKITPGAGGELQLTDGIKALMQHEKVYGYNFEGKRHDAGDKLGFLKATVEFALQREDLGPKFREYLRSQKF